MITKDQRIRIECIKNKLRIGAKIEKADYDFCKINIRLFENIRFKKIRKAMKKWQMLKS
jgi:hypothetical protein